MRKNDGFSVTEVLVATAIVLLIVGTVVPINSLLDKERLTIRERRMITLTLHDEMQPHLWSDDYELPYTKEEVLGNKQLLFHFSLEEDLIKGCVDWKNAKNKQETICLYGYQEQ
ncbi:hypothetical protein GMD78_01815 [Ornithinibacillus sp. L9]|uniref:Prepilin-type N-terminal cleavage/methylation domain-containing protein n=1 Tax=Ornithinibacillus caprae TaxID=2678566 RepID=A0A6N8FCP8_9BACI|nr:prepilin-type N-terminal cleavage/methylation domain-containing protein [Ornithinibacillus caprae]MUK87135.1 hypothetical protein [Ornithinibacillus caprae]